MLCWFFWGHEGKIHSFAPEIISKTNVFASLAVSIFENSAYLDTKHWVIWWSCFQLRHKWTLFGEQRRFTADILLAFSRGAGAVCPQHADVGLSAAHWEKVTTGGGNTRNVMWHRVRCVRESRGLWQVEDGWRVSPTLCPCWSLIHRLTAGVGFRGLLWGILWDIWFVCVCVCVDQCWLPLL